MNETSNEFSKSDILQIADIYERLYYQFVDLMNFSYKLAGSYRKSDAVAAIISDEVSRIDGISSNAVWIITGPNTIVKMAQNGAMTTEDNRTRIGWNANDELGRLLSWQKVAWGPFEPKTYEMLKGFDTPMLFPIRGMDIAQGFLVIDHSDNFDTERCQYITKFSSMILEMSGLYFRLEDEIKERRLLEELLTKEKNKAQSYLDVAEVMLIALDKEGKVDLINRKGCQILGYPPDEVVGKNWFDNFIDRTDKVDLLSVFSKVLNNESDTAKFSENNIITSRGEHRIIEWHNTRVTNDEGRVTGTISCGTDVTEQKKSESEKQAIQAQLFQSQKMEAIGTLVGGIAHDFNNMLQAIIGYSELLFEDMKPGQPGQYEVKTVIQTAHGGAELVKKLMAFGQQALSFPVEFDLNKQIRELGVLLSRTLPQEVDVILSLSDGAYMIYADPNQMDQCIMNLAINGAEAMPNGGVLNIKTENVMLSEEFCSRNPGLDPGSHLALSISDTGRGMDEKTLSRIYEPFFSTKQRGSTRGTGLGLSVVKGILDKQGSLITCVSEPGKGTTFTIYFQSIQNDRKNRAKQPNLRLFNSFSRI